MTTTGLTYIYDAHLIADDKGDLFWCVDGSDAAEDLVPLLNELRGGSDNVLLIFDIEVEEGEGNIARSTVERDITNDYFEIVDIQVRMKHHHTLVDIEPETGERIILAFRDRLREWAMDSLA